MKEEPKKESTLKMLYRFNGIALSVPILACLFVYLYSLVFELSLGKPEWRTIFFVVWLGTVLILLKEGFAKFFSYRKTRRRK